MKGKQLITISRKGLSATSMRKAQQSALAAILGEEMAAEIMNAGEEKTKELEAAGVRFKAATLAKPQSLAAEVSAAGWAAPPLAQRRLQNVARLVASIEHRGGSDVERKDIAHGLKSLAQEVPAGRDRERLVLVADALVKQGEAFGPRTPGRPLWENIRSANAQRRKP